MLASPRGTIKGPSMIAALDAACFWHDATSEDEIDETKDQLSRENENRARVKHDGAQTYSESGARRCGQTLSSTTHSFVSLLI